MFSVNLKPTPAAFLLAGWENVLQAKSMNKALEILFGISILPQSHLERILYGIYGGSLWVWCLGLLAWSARIQWRLRGGGLWRTGVSPLRWSCSGNTVDGSRACVRTRCNALSVLWRSALGFGAVCAVRCSSQSSWVHLWSRLSTVSYRALYQRPQTVLGHS